MKPIFDRTGATVAWLQDDTVRDRSGRPIGFVANEALYTASGRFLCHFMGGFFRDRRGAAIGFVQPHGVGPLPLLTKLPPLPPLPVLAPLRPLFPLPPLAPLPARAWSSLDWAALLGNQAARP